MPTYEYRCTNGHTFEVLQKMTDDPVSACHECGAPVERVFHPVAVHFKGSGFYTTDYARSSTSRDGAKADGGKAKDANKTKPAESTSKPEKSTSGD